MPSSSSSSKPPPFIFIRPRPSDAARIAAIHLAAMDSNPLLHAQFPTREALVGLERFLERNVAEVIREGKEGILLVATEPGLRVRGNARDGEEGGEGEGEGEGGEIVAFARWEVFSPSSSSSSTSSSLQVKKKGNMKEEGEGEEKRKIEEDDELLRIEGCRREFLVGYASLAKEARERHWGLRRGKGFYNITFICTHPAHARRGAGTWLTKHILDLAAADGMPVYLESTDVAVPVYERLGFRVLGGFEMRIPRRRHREGRTDTELEEKGEEKGGGDDVDKEEEEEEEEEEGEGEVYRETCMVWYPPGYQED